MTVSRPPDDSLRDAVLDAAWNRHSTEFPPPHVDAAILAAAHREARTRPQAIPDEDAISHARRPAPAWWGFAAAATIGAIAFGVMQLAPPAHRTEPTVASDVPPPRASASLRDEASSGSFAEAPAADASKPQRNERAPEPIAATPPGMLPAAPSPEGRVAMSRPDGAPRTEPPQRKAAKVAPAGREAASDSAATPGAATIPDAREQRQRPVNAPATHDQRGVVAQQTQPGSEPRVAAMVPPRPATAPSPRAFPGTPSQPGTEGAQPPAAPSKAESATASAARGSAPPERAAAMVAPQPDAAAVAPRDAAATPQGPRSSDSQAVAKMRTTADEWIDRIRRLHAQQRLEDAARELNAFRNAYPDADTRLPASLAAWAAEVKRNAP